MIVDPLAAMISLAPVALYLAVLAWINLRRRPTLVSGGTDTAALAAAVMGLVAVGPMELFFPAAAAAYPRLLLWSILLTFYLLCVTLLLLIMRPRMVIYNVKLPQLRPLLERITAELDSEARWAGDSAELPQLGVQFFLDAYGPMRNITLVSLGSRVNYTGWRRLEVTLAKALRGQTVTRNPRGFSFLAVALVLVGWPAYRLMLEHEGLWERIRNWAGI